MSLDLRRYLQRGYICDDFSGTDIDTARRTNRFDVSNTVVVACACTKHHRSEAAGCDVHCINIIIRPGRVAACEAESCGRENKIPLSNDHRNEVETADYLEEDVSYGFSAMSQDTNLDAKEEDLRKLPTSTPLRPQKTGTSQETSQPAKTMQDKSVRTEFTQDVLSEVWSRTLLDLLKDNRVEPRIIPRGTRKVIAVNTMKRIPVCQRSNHAHRKINRRNTARCRRTNDVEINDFHDISKSKDEDCSLTMYGNSSNYEMFRVDERRSDRIIQTISRNCTEDKLSRRRDPTEHNLNFQDVQKERTYVEYLIDDTLKLLEDTTASGEKRLKIRKNHDGSRRFSQRDSQRQILRGSNFYRS